jgi:septum formation protein
LRVLVMPADVEEGPRPGLAPHDLARLHAGTKAAAARARIGTNVMIAADTVVDVDGTALGKPRDPAEARTMLATLSGREHLVHTAFVVADGASGRTIERCASTRVRFAELGTDEIDAYVATGEPLDKAGAYGIQGRGAALVESIDGDFYTVMGFPLGLFVRSLPELGLYLPHAAHDVARERAAT